MVLMLTTHSRRSAHNGVLGCCIFGYCYSLFSKTWKNPLGYRYRCRCSVAFAVIRYLAPVCPVRSGAFQRVDFICADWSLGFKRSVYTICWARSCEAAVSKRVVGHRFLGALSISIVRRWDDSTQSLAQGSFRSLLFYLFHCMRI
jgi:hypothetical protein